LEVVDKTIIIVNNFHGLLENIAIEFSELRATYTSINQECEDLLHELELSPLNARELAVLVKKLKEARLRRREYADAMSIINPVVNFSFNHKGWVGTIWPTAREMTKIQESLSNRKYTPRVRKDIKLYKGELDESKTEE
jgi:hypothetical protein